MASRQQTNWSLPDWWRKEDLVCQYRPQWSSIWASSRRGVRTQRLWGKAPSQWPACRRPRPCCPHPADWTSPRSSHCGKFPSATEPLVLPSHLKRSKRNKRSLMSCTDECNSGLRTGLHYEITFNELVIGIFVQTFSDIWSCFNCFSLVLNEIL